MGGDFVLDPYYFVLSIHENDSFLGRLPQALYICEVLECILIEWHGFGRDILIDEIGA